MSILKNTTISGTGSLEIPKGTMIDRPKITTTVQSFTSTGTTSWTAPIGVTSVEVLVVAGGGGGIWTGAGGGAGGLIYNPAFSVVPGNSYTVTVGTGGTGSAIPNAATNGGNSVFATLTAIGGGAGRTHGDATAGITGGSGGGAAIQVTGTAPQGGAGTAGQGNKGGNGFVDGNWTGYSAGGGGAGGPGVDAGNGFGSGGGGPGLQFSISGTPIWYAGGGGGGDVNASLTTGGRGGIGGGGNGGFDTAGTAGQPNTGGGGGGGGYTGTYFAGGNGGSGIVIVRYSVVAADNSDPRGLIRYNTDLRSIEVYEGVGRGWVAQDNTRNFGSHNLTNYSQQFNIGNWGPANGTVSAPGAGIAPDGTNTASLLTQSGSTTAWLNIGGVQITSGRLYCFSAHLKAGTASSVFFLGYSTQFGTGATNPIARFDFASGPGSATTIADQIIARGIEQLSNGWYRAYAVFRARATETLNMQWLRFTDPGTTANMLIWGLQIEENVLYPSEYNFTGSVPSPVPGAVAGYRTHIYSTVGNSSFVPSNTGTVEVLVVAGGGGGGGGFPTWAGGGGGGGGGVVYQSSYPVESGKTYPIIVGAGGAAGSSDATNGGNSVFDKITAIGGGRGGRWVGSGNSNAYSGGSGGGGANDNDFANRNLGGFGTVGQGNRGGQGGLYTGSNASSGAGGGGAGSAGGNARGNTGGEGGVGLPFTITSTTTYFGGGGGGGGGVTGGIAITHLGGGGNGGNGTGQNGTSALANTGGGGGGAGSTNTTNTVGGAGGSGIVVVRYRYD